LNKESNEILKKEDGFYLRPIKLNGMPDKIPLLTLIYTYLYNKTFDLVYMKIKIGEKNFWFKIALKIKKKEILIRFFYLFIGISRFMVKIIKEVWKIENLNEYIFIKNYNENDSRMVIKINGEWCTNGSKIVKMIIKSFKKDLSEREIEDMVYKWEIKNNEISERFINLHPIEIKGVDSTHYGTDMLAKDRKLIYFTDFKKSVKNGEYGQECLINKINLSKETKILLPKEESCKLILNKKIRLVKEKNIISGACDNGFNRDLVDKDLANKIEKQMSLESTIKNDLSDIGVSEPDLIKKIIKTLDNNIDLSFITDLFNRKI
jgi:hypothetical protein